MSLLLLRIVSILFPLFAIVALGYLVGRRLRPDLTVTNRINMDVFTPALVFSALSERALNFGTYGFFLLAALLVLTGSGLVAWLVARMTGIAAKTLVPPMMFNNVGNIGLPLAVLAFGKEALAAAVVLFTLSNVLHFSLGTWLLDRQAGLRLLWRSPLIIAALAGLVVSLNNIQLWPPLLTAASMVGEMSIPLALFALGARIANSRITDLGVGLFGAVLRPVSGMLLAWVVLQFIDLPERERGMLLVFGALPPAVLNYMFAERYRQEPNRVASMVLLGNMAALIFLPIALVLVLG